MGTRIRFSVDHTWESWKINVHGLSSQALTGEIGLLEIHIVFAEVFICPETMKLHPESLRESHFEATVTRFEFPGRSGRKSEMQQVGITGCRIVFFEFAATRFDLADRFYPAPGRGRFILKGALPAGRPGFSSSGPGPGISAFYFLEFSSCGPRPFTTRPNSVFLPAGLTVNPALPNGRHRLKMGFISPQRMGFDRHIS